MLTCRGVQNNIVLISGLSIHNIWRLLKFRQFFPPLLADHSGSSTVWKSGNESYDISRGPSEFSYICSWYCLAILFHGDSVNFSLAICRYHLLQPDTRKRQKKEEKNGIKSPSSPYHVTHQTKRHRDKAVRNIGPDGESIRRRDAWESL